MVKVSVISITYNHEKFIRQTLEGFISQKTDFQFEVLVHDDASTDKTADIIREYADKYPTIIKPIFEKENQYSKGTYDFINDMMRQAKGEYLAFCEGDDFWTDEHKLQLQADFLDKHKSYAVCFHRVKVVFENNQQKPYLYPEPKKDIVFDLDTLLRTNFIQMNSVMYRKQDYRSLPNDVMPQDWFLHIYHAKFGRIGFIDKTMSVYRRHDTGVWWDSVNNQTRFWQKNGLAHLKLYLELINLFHDNPAYQHSIYKSMANLYTSVHESDIQSNGRLLSGLLQQFPENTAAFIIDMISQNNELHDISRTLSDELAKITSQNSVLRHDLKQQSETAEVYHHELKAIQSSKTYRYAHKAASLKSKLQNKKKTT